MVFNRSIAKTILLVVAIKTLLKIKKIPMSMCHVVPKKRYIYILMNYLSINQIVSANMSIQCGHTS